MKLLIEKLRHYGRKLTDLTIGRCCSCDCWNAKNYIITARRGSSLGPILNYLSEIGVDPDTVRPIATAGESKGAVIANMIAQKTMADGESNIKRVEYYEDSDKNIQDVMNHICPDKLAELIIYKVVKTEEGYSLQHIGC